MKLRILGDMHHEFYPDRDLSFIMNMDEDFDVLILAGDICSYPFLYEVLETYANLEKDTIFVCGNHEFYRGTKEKVWGVCDDIVRAHSNFYWLNNSFATIQGQRFVGTTLWYPKTATSILNEKYCPDFSVIQGKPNTWIYEEAKIAKKFLDDTVQKGDVVVTHMLPSWQSVHPKYKTEDTNCFFVHDCEQLIMQKEPTMWVHAHTHEHMDYKLGETRVHANPRGYPNGDHGIGNWGGNNLYENVYFYDKYTVLV